MALFSQDVREPTRPAVNHFSRKFCLFWKSGNEKIPDEAEIKLRPKSGFGIKIIVIDVNDFQEEVKQKIKE